MHVAQLLNYVKSYTIMEDDKEIKTIKILIPGDFSVVFFFPRIFFTRNLFYPEI